MSQGMAVGPDEYDEMLVHRLRPLGVKRVNTSSRLDSLDIDDFVIRAPSSRDDYWGLAGSWIVCTVNLDRDDEPPPPSDGRLMN